MSPDICPLCGETALLTKHGEFRFVPPPNIPGGVMIVRDATWNECDACRERIIPYELNEALDREQTRRQANPNSADVFRSQEKTSAPVSVG